MAQTLVVLPALSNPPTLSESNTLMANCSAIQNLDERQILCIRILALIYWLDDAGGVDYKADYPLLISSTENTFGNAWNVITNPLSKCIEGQIEAVLDWSAGYTADNTLPTDVQDLINLMGILVGYPEATLYKVILFLKYKISLTV